MAIRHTNVSIKRDELTTLHVTVAQWEVPLLHIVHGEGAVQEMPGEPWADVDPPEVQDEYRRLESKYRSPPDEDGRPAQRAVALVYGSFGASPQLRQAIQAATFDRPVDLLGIDVLRANANAANAAAAAANAALANVETSSAEVKKVKAKTTPAKSLL